MKHKQIKKIRLEGFSEKTSIPNFLFAYKKAETFWCHFPCSIFAKNNLVFIETLYICHLFILAI